MQEAAPPTPRTLPVRPRWRQRVFEAMASPFLRGRPADIDPRDLGDAPWTDVELRTHEGLRLAAYVAMRQPAGAPAIMLVHGYKSSLDETAALGNALWERGFHVFLFEMRGAGRSDGRFTTLTLLESWDVVRAADAFRALLPDGAPVRVHAFSLGASATITALSRGLLDVESMSFDSACADFDETVRLYVSRRRFRTRVFAPLSLRAAERVLGITTRDIRPVDGVERITRPALFIISGADALIPATHFEQFAASWGGPVEAWHVDGARHCEARKLAWGEYVERVSAWHGMSGRAATSDDGEVEEFVAT